MYAEFTGTAGRCYGGNAAAGGNVAAGGTLLRDVSTSLEQKQEPTRDEDTSRRLREPMELFRLVFKVMLRV